jgi:general secretion pathway protein C
MLGAYWLLISNVVILMVLFLYFYLLPSVKIPVPEVKRENYTPPDLSFIFKEKRIAQTKDLSHLRLLATASGGIKLALLEENGTAKVVRIGSEVEGYRVLDIQRNYLLLSDGKNTKALGFSFKTAKTPAFEPAAGTPEALESLSAVVSKREIENVTADPGIMFRQIRLVPYIQNGQTRGFLFEWVDPQSVFSKAGIRAGDILLAINNQDIKSGEDAFRILQALRNENSLKVSLMREGRPIEINLRVE